MITEMRKRVELFHIQPYRWFAASGLLATFGNGLIYITMAWYAYEQTKSVSAIALLMFFIWAPSILFGPVFGVCADRYNRKYLMVMSNIVRGIVALSFAALLATGRNPSIYILAAMMGVFVSFYMPAAIPTIKDIMGDKDLTEANATVDMLYELGSIVGMGISGFLVVSLGIVGTLAAGGMCFILAGVANQIMKCPTKSSPVDVQPESKPSFLQEYLAALNYLGKHPFLVRIYSIQMLVMVLLMTIPVFLLPYVTEAFNATTKQFAYFEALFSLGVFLGGFVSPVLSRMAGPKTTLVVLSTLLSAGLFSLTAIDQIGFAYLAYIVVGFGLSSWAIIVTEAQMRTEDAFQGRLQATFYSITGVGVLAIYMLVTFHADIFNARAVYLLEAGVALVAALLALTLPPVAAKGIEHQEG